MTATPTIGLVGAGAMGAAVGGSLVASGRRVVSVLSDRSAASRDRARAEGITDVADLGALVAASTIVLSIVPPGVARAVAEEVVVAAKGRSDRNLVLVDCNAISPGKSREIGALFSQSGVAFVDGGIIGAPPASGRPTALYLSGDGGAAIADLLRTPEIRAEWLGPEPAAASALKMAYAGWTKGLNALVLSVRALGRAEGVEDTLVAEWQRSQPGALAAADRSPATAAKAWRWVAEMDEIAASLDDTGLPDGAFRAAAIVYQRLERYKDVDVAPSADDMIDALLSPARWA